MGNSKAVIGRKHIRERRVTSQSDVEHGGTLPMPGASCHRQAAGDVQRGHRATPLKAHMVSMEEDTHGGVVSGETNSEGCRQVAEE